MKKIRKIMLAFLIIFAILFLSAITVGIWQRDNIVAVVKSFTSSTDEIAQEVNENKKQLEEELKKQNINVVSDFTAEEEKQIIKGELSVEEAVEKLMERYEQSQKEESSALSSDTNTSTTPSKPPTSTSAASWSTSASVIQNPQANKLVGEKAVKLYSLKAYYLGQLGQMEAKIKSEYASLPTEKKNLIGKKDIINRHIGTATGLMNQCDASVEEILAELKESLEDLNIDTSIVKTIREAYENEKHLKKSYYLSLLEE